VQVEPRSLSDLNEARTRRADELAHAIKAYIGVGAQVTVMAPGEIERSAGKARRVIDKRPKA